MTRQVMVWGKDSIYDGGMNTLNRAMARATPTPFGQHLRIWRQRRRLTQLDLAHQADVSTRRSNACASRSPQRPTLDWRTC